MTPDEALDQYRRLVGEDGETVYVRRFTGSTPTRTHVDTATTARVIGYQPQEIVGTVKQGDRKVIMLVDTLSDILPLTMSGNDKLVVRGDEIAIIAVDDSTRRVGGTLIALEVQVRG